MHEMHFVCSFFSAARRTNQEAPPRLSGFWLVATVAVGVCGTRFARTVLALFPPSSLRLHRPIKAESGVLACILTPSPSSPPIFLVGTQGERRVNSITPTSGIFNPSPRRYAPQFSPIFSCTTPRNASGHGRGRRLDTNNFLSLPKIVSVALICVICSFFSATRRTNQEAPPFLLTPPSLRTPPLYFALQNTGEEGEMYFFALISVKCDTMGGEIAFFFFGI